MSERSRLGLFLAQRRLKADIRRYRSPQAPPTSLPLYLSLTPTGFEYAVARLLAQAGYRDVGVTGGAGDLAADITAVDPNGRSAIVQCKRYAVSHKVGSREVQQFIGMAVTHHRAERMLYVTTSQFTDPARRLGEQHGVVLFDGSGLLRLSREVADTISRSEATVNAEFVRRQKELDVVRSRRQEAKSESRNRRAKGQRVQQPSTPAPDSTVRAIHAPLGDSAELTSSEVLPFSSSKETSKFKITDRRAARQISEPALEVQDLRSDRTHATDNSESPTALRSSMTRAERMPRVASDGARSLVGAGLRLTALRFIYVLVGWIVALALVGGTMDHGPHPDIYASLLTVVVFISAPILWLVRASRWVRARLSARRVAGPVPEP